MRSRLSQIIAERHANHHGHPPLLILDGAIATALESELHLDLHENLWSAMILDTNPDGVQKLHRMYLDAGVDIITTCSYQISFQDSFMKISGLKREQVSRLLQKSLQIADQARREFWCERGKYVETAQQSRYPLIAFSMSSYGASIAVEGEDDVAQEYSGEYVDPDSKYYASSETIKRFHWERLACVLHESLQSSLPDIILFETVPALAEAAAICEMLHEKADRLQGSGIGSKCRDRPGVIISFSCRDAEHTYHGDSLINCAKLIDECPLVDGISVNCTAPKFVPDIVATLRRHTQKLVGCYPNNGDVWNQCSKSWKQAENANDRYGPALAKQFIAAGADIIGGCCRTTPQDMKAISHAIQE